MNTTVNRFIGRNSAFAWIASGAGALLLIPLGAMQLTTSVDWGVTDFVAMGVLLFVSGSLFVLAARKVSPMYRLVVGVLVVAAFLYVWAELAVGIFTSLGS